MTAAQDITRHYGGDWHGNYGSFPAPGHTKHDRGVTVKDTESGDVLFNSFNGADWRAIKDECRANGLLPERQMESRAQWRETAKYEYANESGQILYRTIRIERTGAKKKFRAERLDDGGRWIGNMGKVRRVLYRLPDITQATGRATLTETAMPTIYLVEGERKADKLAGWGLLATAVAFGAKGWRSEYADALAGCTVIILPDNDEEGRGFADRAAKDLSAARCTVHIIDLPGLPPKGDIMDWAGTADELRALAAKLTSPPPDIFPLADLALWSCTAPTPKPFLMRGFVPAGELTLATGAGGANKSTFGQQLATCVAAGVPMLGMDVMAGKALYITAEDDDDRLHWMQAHICRSLNVSMADLADKLHISSLRGRLGNELATFDHEGKLRPAKSFNILKATIEATGADLIVLDNAAHLFAGNENDRQQVTAFVNLLYSLCRGLGVTIILVAHANKAGDTYSGSTAWLNAVRSQIVMSRPDGSIDPDERVLSLGKANYARQGEEIRCRWHDFSLILEDDLSDDVRAEIAETAAAASDNAAFLACLEARERDGLIVSPNVSPNYAPSQFEAMPKAKGIGRDRLRAAMERLLTIGKIEVYDHENKDKRRTVKAIRLTSRTSPDVSPDVSRTLSRTSPAPGPNGPRTTPRTHPSPKGEEGAAFGAAAPSPDMDDGLDADGNIIGWTDGGMHQ